MSRIKIVEKTTNRNVGRARNKVKLQLYKNVLTGNIIEGSLDYGCEPQLDFSCPDNSQYSVTII